MATALPPAVFIEDVEKYLQGQTADEAIAKLNKQYQLYKMVEQQLTHKRIRLIGKLPEIQKALDAVNSVMKAQEQGDDVVLDFELADNIYAKGRIKPVETVNLWLGANVMLEYKFEEAQQLLAQNVQNCRTNLETNKKDLDSIKDYITTTEVSMARIYNYDVSLRRNKQQPA